MALFLPFPRYPVSPRRCNARLPRRRHSLRVVFPRPRRRQATHEIFPHPPSIGLSDGEVRCRTACYPFQLLAESHPCPFLSAFVRVLVGRTFVLTVRVESRLAFPKPN